MSTLEPIEEKDLDLKNKFSKENPINIGEKEPTKKPEKITVSESRIEQIEEIPEKESFYKKLLDQVKGQGPLPIEKDIPLDASTIAQFESVEEKIGELVKITINKGPIQAIKVARHLDDNYILDELHGRLLGEELRDDFIKKGWIKNL